MPRQKFDFENPPRELKELQKFIEDIGRCSDSAVLRRIQILPIMRNFHLICSDTKLPLKPLYGKEAALAQRRGYEAEEPCNHCAAGGGPGSECVLLDRELAGGCANCYFSRKTSGKNFRCSLALPGTYSQAVDR